MSEAAEACWLCARPLGALREQHNPVPKSRGGRITVPVHPVCHRAIHSHFTTAELGRLPPDPAALATVPEMARFLAWIADKPPDFHVRTAKARRRR